MRRRLIIGSGVLLVCAFLADWLGSRKLTDALFFLSWLSAVLWIIWRLRAWEPYLSFFRWLQRREEERQRIVVVAKPVPPPFRTQKEMEALVQSWLDGTLLPETPKKTVIRTTVIVRRVESEE